MADNQHPALAHEARRLALTLSVIDDEVRTLRELGWSGDAAAHAAFQARKWAWDKSDRLLAIRSSPYFGRIDVDGAGGKIESYYIGPEGLPGPSRGERLIIDWRAPISAAFYRPDQRTALRRRIEISQSQIVRLYDDHVRSGPCAGQDPQSDPMLHDILTRAQGAHLGSIVRTIQAKQDEIIRTTDDVTVVQGAAGAGKTVVALHRLAYLLYQSRVTADSGEDVQAGYAVSRRRTDPRASSGLRAAVFGPNRTYLRHIRSVLPALGENDVVQTTFEEWVLGSLADEGLSRVSAADDLELLLDASIPREERERLFRRSRTKGSIGMGQTLRRYATSEVAGRLDSLRRDPLVVEADVVGRRYTLRVAPPVLDVRERLSRGTTLARVRALVRQLMRQNVREQAQKSLMERGILGGRSGDDSRRCDEVLGRFDVAFERSWPQYSVLDLYRRFLADKPELRKPAREVESRSPQGRDPSFEFALEDIAPIAYLRLLIEGPIPIHPPASPDARWTRLDHIVIDEAQDLSPLALTVLRAHAHQVTVLGDMNQAIYAHRGSRSWKEILPSLGRRPQQIHALTPTYRSTKQIAELANHIVRVSGLDGGVCRSFPRTGLEPRLLQAIDPAQVADAVIALVKEVCTDEASTVAVLTRTASDARRLFGSFADRLPITSVCITDRRDALDGRAYFMPAYLAKGVEFDAVVVTDVDDVSYGTTANDATLLYVAVTRALHRLLIVWSGRPSRLIADLVRGTVVS